MCADFVEKMLGYKISFNPKGSGSSVGEFLIELSAETNIFVEVKSPIGKSQARIWMGNDARAIRSNVVAARRQMPETGRNLLILAGSLRLPISSTSTGILQALYGDHVVAMPVYSDGSAGKAEIEFRHSGVFQPTANRRISAVATLDYQIGSPYLDSCLIHVLSNRQTPIDSTLPMHSFKYILTVYHNPYAQEDISRDVFKGWPQFIPNRDANRMEWIDS